MTVEDKREANLCHFCLGTSPSADETYFDECDNCREEPELESAED